MAYLRKDKAMKAIVRLYRRRSIDQDGLARDLVSQSVSQLESWAEEHENYYARAGCRVDNRLTIGPELPELGSYFAGFKRLEGGGRWMTSNGNYSLVMEDQDGVLIFVDGRRHGVRWPVDLTGYRLENGQVLDADDDLVGIILAYESQRQDAAPWEMGLESVPTA